MSWATPWIEKLEQGETVSFRPRGNSMSPKIESGQLVTVQPIMIDGGLALREGDIVLCSVGRNDYLHLIVQIRGGLLGLRFQIGNNKGHVNGWTAANKIYGRVIKVEP